MREFDINKLPVWCKKMIYHIEFTHEEEDGILGECFLKDGFVLDDYCHCFSFSSRKDLIETLDTVGVER